MSTARTMETSSDQGASNDALGADARALLEHRCGASRKDALHLPGAGLRGPRPRRLRPPGARAAQPAAAARRTAAWPAPATSPSCPSTRASSTRRARPSPRTRLLRPREHREARDRGRLQRGGLDAGRAGHRWPGAYAHQIPFIVKINHNEFLTYPNKFDQITVRARRAGGGHGRGRGGGHHLLRLRRSRPGRSRRWARPSSARTSWAWPPSSGATCATPPSRRRRRTTTLAADLTGQANHLGVTLEADIIKQKLPENNGGYNALSIEGEPVRQDRQARLRRRSPRDNPIDLTPLPGRELLHGPRGPHQLRRRLGRERLRGGGARPRSSTSARAAWASSPAARPSSARWPRASSC